MQLAQPLQAHEVAAAKLGFIRPKAHQMDLFIKTSWFVLSGLLLFYRKIFFSGKFSLVSEVPTTCFGEMYIIP